jgi:hypothetical protein
MGAAAAIAGRVLIPTVGRAMSGGGGPANMLSLLTSQSPGGMAFQALADAAGSGLSGSPKTKNQTPSDD